MEERERASPLGCGTREWNEECCRVEWREAREWTEEWTKEERRERVGG